MLKASTPRMPLQHFYTVNKHNSFIFLITRSGTGMAFAQSYVRKLCFQASKNKNTQHNAGCFYFCSPKKISANLYPRLAELNPQVKILPAKGTAQEKRNLKQKI